MTMKLCLADQTIKQKTAFAAPWKTGMFTSYFPVVIHFPLVEKIRPLTSEHGNSQLTVGPSLLCLTVHKQTRRGLSRVHASASQLIHDALLEFNPRLKQVLPQLSYTVFHKKTTPYLIAHNFRKCWPLTDFHFFFTRGLSRDRVMNWSLNVPSHLKRVDTHPLRFNGHFPCEPGLAGVNVRKLPTIWNKCLV